MRVPRISIVPPAVMVGDGGRGFNGGRAEFVGGENDREGEAIAGCNRQSCSADMTDVSRWRPESL